MGLLRGVSTAFDKIDLVQCLGIGAIEIAVELLKNAGDEDDSKKSRVSSVFYTPNLLLSAAWLSSSQRIAD
jgi:hypothetical protein